MLLLSAFLYRHGPGHPVTVWQDQEDAKGTTSTSYFRPLGAFTPRWCLQTLSWKCVGAWLWFRGYGVLMQGYGGLGVGVPLSSWTDRDVAVPRHLCRGYCSLGFFVIFPLWCLHCSEVWWLRLSSCVPVNIHVRTNYH